MRPILTCYQTLILLEYPSLQWTLVQVIDPIVNGKFNILINFTLHPSGQFVAQFLVGVILLVW